MKYQILDLAFAVDPSLPRFKSGCQRKPGKMLKMSTEGGQQNKFILTTQIGLASLYSTPSDAIFISKFSPFSETHRTLKI